MYLKRIIADCPPRNAPHHRSIDDYLVIEHHSGFWGFDTNETTGIASIRDGINLDEPGDIADVPREVLAYIRMLGYRVEGAEVNSNILDADESSPAEGYEIWV